MIIWIGCPFDELLARVVLTVRLFLQVPVGFTSIILYYMGVNIFLCVCGNTLLKSRKKAIGIYNFRVQIFML